MSTPPFGLHSNTSVPNVPLPPYASTTPHLMSPFHPVPGRIHHGTGFVPASTLPSADLSLGAYRDTPDPAANREDSRRASTYTIPIPERIHRGTDHRASADNVLHEMRAIASSSSRGEGAFVGESTSTSTGQPLAMGGRERTVAAGSAFHEYGPYWRIAATPYGHQPAFSRPPVGSSRLGREVLAGNTEHERQSSATVASDWVQRSLESITPPDPYPQTRSFGSEITSSQSPEGGHVLTAASGSDGSGTPSAARPIPIPANPPQNWEDRYALQQVIERDARVANDDGFGGVVTLPESSTGFPHTQAATQCDPGAFAANSYVENPSAWNTRSSERVQIAREDAAVSSTSALPSFLSGPSSSSSASTGVSSGTGFGTNVKINDDTRYAARQYLSQNFHRLTLPTPVPFGQNPSSNPLPRRPYSSSESSADYLSGSATTPPIASQGTPKIATPAETTTRPTVLALGTRAPTSSPAQSPQKSSGSARGPRKKIHACWMCHKTFDRPSTLKKHLLVHTGEKAFACRYCNRRFGVASNLNRHIKRCPQFPKDASALAGPSSKSPSTFVTSTQPASTTCTLNLNLREQVSFSESSPFELAPSANATVSTLNLHEGPFPSSSTASSFYVYPDTQTGSMARAPRFPDNMQSTQPSRRRARGGSGRNNQRPSTDRLSASAPDLPSPMNEGTLPSRRPRSASRSPTDQAHTTSEAVFNTEPGSSTELAQQEVDKPRKRARRPPSRSTWVPESLANFEIHPAPALTRAAPCPLPPVKPFNSGGAWFEERDSFESTLAAMMPPGASDDESSSSADETGNDENAEPGTAGAFDASSRARERAQARANRAAARETRSRAWLALYKPYHPDGYRGRLPGPAVVLGTGPEGNAVIERTPVASGSGSGSGAAVGGEMVGADMTNLRFEVITGEPSAGASGSSSRGAAP